MFIRPLYAKDSILYRQAMVTWEANARQKKVKREGILESLR